MAYGFQLGFSIPEINLNPPEQIPGYPHAPLNQGYDPGHWIQDVGPCPSFAEQPPLGYGGDTYTGRTMPAPWPYGFHSANWLEEQQSWRPELPPQPPDDGTLQLVANEQQGFGAPGIGFETFGSPWLNECGAPCPVTGWEFQDNTSRSPCYSFDVQTFSQIPDKRRCSLYHKESGDVAAGTAWQGKARSQSLCIPTSEHGFLSQPFTGPESATWSPVNPERSIEEREFQIQLVEPETSSNKELTDFCDSVKFIRSKYPATDPVANSGRIWSIAIRYPNQTAGDSEVTVTVYGDSLSQPVICTQRDCALVQDLMADVVHQIPLHPLAVEPLLSVCGYDECLQNGFTLKSHWRLKRETFLRLRLHCTAGPLLARTCEDDQQELHLDDFLEHSSYWKGMKDRLFRAVANYEEQVKRLLYSETHVNHVMEAVKEVCYTLCSVETQEIRDAISALYGSCLRSAQSWQPSAAHTARAEVQSVVMQLSKALSNLINIFSRSFHTEFLAEPSTGQSSPDPHTEPHFTFHLYAAHNLQSSWLRSSDIFVCCSLIYAGRKICQEIKSNSKPSIQALFSMVIFNEWITFPVPLQSLPYESMLFVKLCGVSESSPHPTTLAWTCAPLYSRQRFVHGPVLLNMVSHLEPPPVITPGALDILLPTLVTLQVDFLERNIRFTEHEPGADSYHNQTSHEDPMNRLEVLAHRHSVLLLSEADKHCMWRYRSGCNTQRNILPLVLGSAPGWDPDSISSMLTILRSWTFHDPLEALGLLNPCFSDQNIRETACQQIGNLSNDELFQYLPQLIQALKFEWSVDNPLMRLLLERSLQSIQIAHRLYWLLTDALNQAHYRGLYKKYLSALQHCAGKALNEEFIKQKKLMKILQEIAEKVRSAQDVKRQEILQGNLAQLEHIFQEVHICRLPQDPAIVVKGINPTSCSYFKSNASPLKISFVNADPLGKNINVIFKAGDDLRQDMLVLQIIEIMDRIWLQEGLDLRMITYRCLSTGTKQGLVQMVPHATTLAKIHQRSGILGPLKDGTIKKWFGSDKSREASDNFLYSCAGWCVVTFILGVCDRHNDNIMITDTGHVFHIDFGKFLGHSQKFGSIKRDRVPFIFTTEMEYFITEGGKYPQRSQEFVELCCRAYNILRRHSRVLINLMELMLQAGLPELCDVEDLRYMHNNLRPQDSDLQATSYFTRKIEESLQCLPVKLNNMIHILANMSLSDTAKSASQMNPPSVSPKNLIRKAAAAGMRKIHEKSGRILHLMTDERLYPDRSSGSQRSPGVQLHISYSKPKLSILLKHLKNVHLPDGSSPTAAAEMSLLRLPNEKMEKKIKAKTKSANPTFNEIVEFYVQELDGYVLNVVVKSKGTFVAAVNIRLDTVTLNKDVWYPLGRSMH